MVKMNKSDSEIGCFIKASLKDADLQEIVGIYSILTERKNHGDDIAILYMSDDNNKPIMLLPYLYDKVKEYFLNAFDGNEVVADTLTHKLLFEDRRNKLSIEDDDNEEECEDSPWDR